MVRNYIWKTKQISKTCIQKKQKVKPILQYLIMLQWQIFFQDAKVCPSMCFSLNILGLCQVLTSPQQHGRNASARVPLKGFGRTALPTHIQHSQHTSPATNSPLCDRFSETTCNPFHHRTSLWCQHYLRYEKGAFLSSFSD